jgi:ubiquitin carboxyl-terminal hydrolase 4/11/15
VLTSGSDGDFSAGGTSSSVVATSIDGEDELVDVTMKDLNGVRESIEKSPASSKQLAQEKNS